MLCDVYVLRASRERGRQGPLWRAPRPMVTSSSAGGRPHDVTVNLTREFSQELECPPDLRVLGPSLQITQTPKRNLPSEKGQKKV